MEREPEHEKFALTAFIAPIVMSKLSHFIQLKIAETLGTKPEEVGLDEEFMTLGLDSMHAIFLIDEIEKEFNVEINPHSFWEYPTIKSFSENLEKKIAAKSAHP